MKSYYKKLKNLFPLFWKWIFTYPKETVIGSLILFCHLLFFFASFGTKGEIQRKKTLIVKTYSPSPQLREKSLQAVTAPPPSFPHSTAAKTGKKGNKIAKPSPLKKGKPDSAKEMIKKIEETIAKIEEKQDKSEGKMVPLIPEPIDILHIDQEEGENGALETIILALKKKLRLPEQGKVKMKLLITGEGIIKEATVLSSESEKNKRYLEALLPEIRIPLDGQGFEKQKPSIFIFTFCNVE